MRDEIYLEDISVGTTFTTDEITVTEAEIIEFAKRFDPQPFHTDPDAARGTFFGGLAASGWHTAALTMNLLVTQGPRFAGGTIGASGQLSWPTATRPGDRLHVTGTVDAVSESKSKPDRGMAVIRIETLTSEGELRQLFVVNSLVFRRPEQPS